jgi:hypothetical protein
MVKITIEFNIRKPTKKELKIVWEIGALFLSLTGAGLGIKDLIIRYNLGILFEPQYYFSVGGRIGVMPSYFYNFLPIVAIFLLLSCAVVGVFEIKKLVQEDPDIPSKGHL